MIYLTEQEWTQLQEKTKQVLEDTVKQAVKDAVTPLLSEIAALNVEKAMWDTNYNKLYKDYTNLQGWNTIGWITSAIGIGALILTWATK